VQGPGFDPQCLKKKNYPSLTELSFLFLLAYINCTKGFHCEYNAYDVL
jgi:hypothetical protein